MHVTTGLSSVVFEAKYVKVKQSVAGHSPMPDRDTAILHGWQENSQNIFDNVFVDWVIKTMTVLYDA